MKIYRLSAKPYTRQFNPPLRTAHGLWRKREGILVRLDDGEGHIGYGEIAPVPSFGTETLEAASEFIFSQGSLLSELKLARIPSALPCVRYGLESALWDTREAPHMRRQNLPVAGLVPSGAQGLKLAAELIKSGYTCLKWKVRAGPAREMELFENLLRLLPGQGNSTDVRLRIDANGSLSDLEARRWLKRCAEVPAVEFIEQPLPVGQEAAMRLLAASFPTPIALDESISTFEKLKAVTGAGWRGPLVIKPSLLGNLQDFLRWRGECPNKLIYSSVFETAIGMQTALKVAATDAHNTAHVGFGTLEMLKDDGLNLHMPAAKLGAWLFEAPDFERLWKSL